MDAVARAEHQRQEESRLKRLAAVQSTGASRPPIQPHANRHHDKLVSAEKPRRSSSRHSSRGASSRPDPASERSGDASTRSRASSLASDRPGDASTRSRASSQASSHGHSSHRDQSAPEQETSRSSPSKQRVYREPGTESSKLLQDVEDRSSGAGTDLTMTFMLSPSRRRKALEGVLSVVSPCSSPAQHGGWTPEQLAPLQQELSDWYFADARCQLPINISSLSDSYNFADMIKKAGKNPADKGAPKKPEPEDVSDGKARDHSSRRDPSARGHSSRRDSSAHGRHQSSSRASSKESSNQQELSTRSERVYREPGTESSKLLRELDDRTSNNGTDLTMTFMISPARRKKQLHEVVKAAAPPGGDEMQGQNWKPEQLEPLQNELSDWYFSDARCQLPIDVADMCDSCNVAKMIEQKTVAPESARPPTGRGAGCTGETRGGYPSRT